MELFLVMVDVGLLSWMFRILAVIWTSRGGPGRVRSLGGSVLLMVLLRLVRCLLGFRPSCVLSVEIICRLVCMPLRRRMSLRPLLVPFVLLLLGLSVPEKGPLLTPQFF